MRMIMSMLNSEMFSEDMVGKCWSSLIPGCGYDKPVKDVAVTTLIGNCKSVKKDSNSLTQTLPRGYSNVDGN